MIINWSGLYIYIIDKEKVNIYLCRQRKGKFNLISQKCVDEKVNLTWLIKPLVKMIWKVKYSKYCVDEKVNLSWLVKPLVKMK